MEPPSNPPSFTLLLASTRWGVHAFFAGLRAHGLPEIAVEPIPDPLDDLSDDALAGAAAAAIDLAPNPLAGIETCRSLRERRPTLPIVALLCCPEAVNPWHLRELVRDGASVLDLQATPEEAVRALESMARGSSVLHLHLRRGQRALLRDILSGREATTATKIRVLELVSFGLPDHEIGARLHLSPHTVKHHIEALRDEIGARNRIELAAWAGQNGFYEPGSADAPDSVPVKVARSPQR
jgi:DNA-binding NarL/FixJ family response regulator